jgi:hypothetical protein
MTRSLLSLFILIFCAAPALAQETPQMGPPKVLLIVREEIKPGMMPAHTRHSGEFVQVFNQLQTPNRRIAMVPVAGNENEVFYITGAQSFAEIETINRSTDQKMGSANGTMRVKLDALEKEAPGMHSAMRDMMAVFRPELSFNPGVNIAQMRYFTVTTTRIRPGFDGVYQEYVQKLINVVRQKANITNLHVAVFQVVSGAPGGTYLSFRPMKSLAEMDNPVGMKVRAAMSDDQRKDADKAVREAIMSTEVTTYAFAPSMSYVDREFAAMDSAFWSPKPQTAVRPRPRR